MKTRKSKQAAAPPNYKGYRDPSFVIPVEQAQKLISMDDVLFIDTRNYWKYVEGHIPGAFNIELYAFHWIDTSKRGIRAFLRQMEFLFSSVGLVRNRQEVVFYQNNSGYDAARGVWLLNYMGHTKARILDGGLNAWKRAGLPLSAEDPVAVKRGHFVARPNESLIATCDLVSSRLGKSNATTLVDTRSPGEFSGRYRRALHAGHVPSSKNIEWKLALRRDGTLKSARELGQIFSSVPEGDEVITYCQSGYRAAHSWLVLRLLGYSKARNYLGSWYEWGNSRRPSVTLKDDGP